MHIIFLNGSEFRGNWREFIRALWHPLFVALILAMTGIIFLVRPYDHIMPEGVILRTLIVTSSVVVYLAFSVFLISRIAHAKRRIFTITVFVPANIVTSLWAVRISVYAGGNGLDAVGWAQLLAFNFVFFLVGELILASFLLRHIVPETVLQTYPIAMQSPSDLSGAMEDEEGHDKTPAPPQILEVLGKAVLLDQIWHLKAEEHYVLLGLCDGTSTLLRGRLADAIAQVPPEAGLQVHRSHWVAKSALADLERRREGWRLRLHNGTDIPVARNRQTDVRIWVEDALQTA